MRVIGIIAEFNPFHKGHEYLMQRAREEVNDPRAIVMAVMSGPFVQRGTPSVLPKNIRAKQALMCGADVVIELPFTFACAPSERFAAGAVEMLFRTGVVTDIAFGIDSEDPELIKLIADTDPDDDVIKKCLSDGMSFPAARAEGIVAAVASHSILDADKETSLRNALRQPNSILAADYLRAIKEVGADSRFKVHMIPRKEGYSATSSREIYLAHDSVSALCDPISELIPDKALAVMLSGLSCRKYSFPDTDLFASDLINDVRRFDISHTAYMGDGLDGFISNTFASLREQDYKSLRKALQTKHFTMPRIGRALSSLAVGQKEEYIKEEKHPRYIRILGFNREGRYCLKIMSKCARLPILSNCSDAKEHYASDPALKAQFLLDINAQEVQGRYLSIIPGSQWSEAPIKTK
ncbi:MAG: nucleotidyltransferase family protein [Saccharofermentans sp.]|nr:nucleotidyltransferase family protein [Saccharofermentans sp.]